MSTEAPVNNQINPNTASQLRNIYNSMLPMTNDTLAFRECIKNVRTEQVYAFLDNVENVDPIGSHGRRMEGIIFTNTSQNGEKTELVKLYYGTKLDPDLTEEFLQKHYPKHLTNISVKRGCIPIRNRVSWAKDEALDLQSHQYDWWVTQNYPYYFAACEAMTRAVAHSKIPDFFYAPNVLTDDMGNPVGFSVELPSPVASVQDMCVVKKGKESVFYSHREDIHPEIKVMIDQMARINVHIYNDIWPDLENQLLLDQENHLIGIARVGFFTGNIKFD